MVQCDYCGREVEDTESTSEVGHYCIDCHRLTRDNCNEAIRELKRRKRERKRGGESWYIKIVQCWFGLMLILRFRQRLLT